MKTLLVAALLILSCGGWGLSAARELFRREQQVQTALRITLRLRTEVCVCRRPLTEALEDLRREYPGSAEEDDIRLEDCPFRTFWESFVRKIVPTGPAFAALSDLGGDLTRGEIPEEAFRRCVQRLEQSVSEAEDRRKAYARVYIALGFAAGGALTLLTL